MGDGPNGDIRESERRALSRECHQHRLWEDVEAGRDCCYGMGTPERYIPQVAQSRADRTAGCEYHLRDPEYMGYAAHRRDCGAEWSAYITPAYSLADTDCLVWWTLGGTVVLVITLLVKAPMRDPAHFVFLDFEVCSVMCL
jgi:hypothetical protein